MESNRLKRFELYNQYETNLKSDEYIEPQVSYVDENTNLYYDNITFIDPEVRRIIDNKWFDGDGKFCFSKKELSQITFIGTTFANNSNIKKFDEFDSFVGLTALDSGNSTVGCFSGCYNLKSITLPPNIKSINSYCFNDTLIESLVFPEGFTTVSGWAIRGYRYLTYIEFPSTLTSIDRNNFCPSNNYNVPTKVVIKATTPPTITANGCFYYYSGAFRPNTAAKIYVPYSSDHSILTSYQNSEGWSTILGIGVNILELDENGNIPNA